MGRVGGSSARNWITRLSLAALALFAIAPAGAGAAVITPDTFTDDLTVNGNCTLREAVKSATGAGAFDACSGGTVFTSDQIVLAAGIYELTLPNAAGDEDSSLTGDLDLLAGLATPELTIVGHPSGSTIDANGIDGVFEVRGSNAELEIEGVTITGGSDATRGGGLDVDQESSLVLRDSVVRNNSAVDGGGINVDLDSSLEIYDSEIRNNDASDRGGGIFSADGGDVLRSVISDNDSGSAEADGGGGIFSSGGFMDIEDSLITGNDAPGLADGGGVAVAGSGSVRLTNTTVSTNSAHDGGGIHQASSGNSFLDSVTVALNSASQAGGGVARAVSGLLFTKRSILGDNTAPSGPDCSGSISSQGHNLLETTAGCTFSTDTGDITNSAPQIVAALAFNGGPTRTHALQTTSPAINNSGGTSVPPEDQRGAPRTGSPDIGAYERVLCEGVLVNLIGTDNVDNLTGTSGADGILAMDGSDTVNGGSGNDGICGGDDNDTLNGQAGQDKIAGEAGVDTVSGGGDEDTIDGGTGNDVLSGDGGDDTIDGGAGNDNLNGGADGDTLNGQADDDTLIGGAGIDKLTGGTGLADSADYSGAAASVVVSLDDGEASADGDGSSDIVIESIEDLTGSPQGDTLEGDGADNTIVGGGGDDQISGQDGQDDLDGGAQDDDLFGGDEADTLDGGAGDDTLAGAGGEDQLIGGSGTGDTADYSGAAGSVEASLSDGETSVDGDGKSDPLLTGIENLTGSPQSDALEGDGTKNVISGGGGGDEISGQGGSDTLEGGADADTLQGGDGDDTLTGGPGTDTADYSPSATPITVDTSANKVSDNFTDTLADVIESFRGSNLNDRFVGTEARVEIFNGRGGTDAVDYADAPAGVTLDLGAGSASDDGGGSVDTLVSIEDATGSAQADSITGSSAANALFGLAGDDTLAGAAGQDELSGGGGSGDTADYSVAVGKVEASLADGEASTDGHGSSDPVIIGIENLTGSPQEDILEGDAAANTLEGGAGDDQIAGDSGIDTLNGGPDSDTLDGGDGDDTLTGGPGTDTADYSASTTAITVDTPGATVTDGFTDSLADVIEGFRGSSLDDRFEGTEARAETFDGNGGSDQVDYSAAPAGVTLDLGAGSAADDGGGAADTLVSIEDATGSDFADSLTGSSAQNALFGLAGDDTLNSQDGGVADTLDCGPHINGDTANLDIQDTETNCEILTVPAAGQPGGPPIDGGNPQDTVAPTLSAVKVTKKFSVTKKKTAVNGTASTSRVRKGGVISWKLDEAAEVEITVQKKVKGIRIKTSDSANPGKTIRKCVKGNGRNKRKLYAQKKAKSKKQRQKALRKARCNRFVRKGKKLTRSGQVGSSRTGFSGRIGKKAVGRGKFRVVLVATDSAGNASGSESSNVFKIVKKKKKKK